MRIQVFLSRNGVCSRREAMAVVQSGRVMLNGQICDEPSTPVDPRKDHVFVDGKRVQGKSYEYILLNKPKGYTTTKSDRHAEKTVLDLLPKKFQHLSPVGRLDRDTEGLLLMTNDGDAAYRLTHPKFNVDKIYFVRIRGSLTPDMRGKLEKGLFVDGKRTLPAKIRNIKPVKDKTEMLLTIHEGRKRQIRLMFAQVGTRVVYLKRLVQGPIILGALPKGAWRSLDEQEIQKIAKI